MSYEQFKGVLDIVEKNVDAASLSYDEEDEDNSKVIPVGQRSKVLSIDDEYDGTSSDKNSDEEDETDEEEFLEEMHEIFDELREKDKNLPLVNFLQWNEMQMLLETKALTADNLANCIEKVGVVVDKSGRANQDLTFQMFSDLVSIIEEYIDKDKLVDIKGTFCFFNLFLNLFPI